MAVINRIAGFADEMTGWRRHIHAHPELGLECHQTAAFVVERLREFGVDEIHGGIATSGIVAIIQGQGEGPTTGLRADMDALPMNEETGLEYASTIHGRMHACGHDGHTTMLLGAAKYLTETRNFTGRVALIFQPAEEITGGGRIMVQDEGIMDRFSIEEVYGLHTNPFLEEGVFETSQGAFLAAVDDFYVTIKGVGGHAAYPEGCVDPIPAASAMVGALQQIVARNVSPHDRAVITVTQIHGGSAINVIPEMASFCGTMRTLTPEARTLTEMRLREVISGVAAAYGVEVEIKIEHGYPPTVNHADQAVFAAGVAAQVGASATDEARPEMGAEDFSYMLEARPGAFLSIGQGFGPGLHHPGFNFNDKVAPIGASFFAKLIETRHARPS
ncbi:MAG: amidohydrolase [Marinovum sp.]|nr:amidohydrolase [Marinovum sp.]